MAITSNCSEIIITYVGGSTSFNKLITTVELSPAKTIHSESRVYLTQNSENAPQQFWWNLAKAQADGYSTLQALYDYFNSELANQCGGGGTGDPASPTTSVQYNNSGSFGGNGNFTYTTYGSSFPSLKVLKEDVGQGKILTRAVEYNAKNTNSKTSIYANDDTPSDYDFILPSEIGNEGDVLTLISDGKTAWVAGGGGGAFIPLSGTTAGNPVTGDIEMSDNNSIYQGTDDAIKLSVKFKSGQIECTAKDNTDGSQVKEAINHTGYSVEATSSGSANIGLLSFTTSGLSVSSDDATSQGVVGQQDFSSNAKTNPLAFVQYAGLDHLEKLSRDGVNYNKITITDANTSIDTYDENGYHSNVQFSSSGIAVNSDKPNAQLLVGFRFFINQSVSADDATLNATPGKAYILPVATSNHDIFFDTPQDGDEYIFVNPAQTGFGFTFDTPVFKADGTNIGALDGGVTYKVKYFSASGQFTLISTQN